jgi:NADPH-dependent 2,4-dienoyl-CoA reductase/sulfur reductase-like enzyme/rhodanese-related sulfurtransferase
MEINQLSQMNNMKQYSDYAIIGGLVCGPKTAAALARRMPKAKITIFEKGERISYGSCGLPYFASGDINSFEELTRTAYGLVRNQDFFRDCKGFEIKTGMEVIAIDRKRKVIQIRDAKSGEVMEHGYDKLIIAAGSEPVQPPFSIPTSDRIRNFARPEDAIHFRALAEKGKIGSAIILGGGFIGCELAETCGGMWGIETTLAEKEYGLLPDILDKEVSSMVEAELRRKKVELILGATAVKVEIDSDGLPTLYLSNNKTVSADFLFLCMGARPNIRLAKEAGLAIGPAGGILVNSRMQTSDSDIYAGGDCVELTHQLGGHKINLSMGSLANRHGWIIAENLAGNPTEFPGVLGAALIKIFDINVGAIGLSEQAARKAGYETSAVWGSFTDKPDYYPDKKGLTLKMVYSATDNRLLGLQAVGNGDICRRIDDFSIFLQKKGTIDDLISFEHGYAPPYADAMDPLHHLAAMAVAKRRGIEFINPIDIRDGDWVILDVREIAEAEAEPLPGLVSKENYFNIPIGQLTRNLNRLNYDMKIAAVCKRGPRAYQAAVTLKNAGFQNVRIIGGGIQMLY